MAIARAAERQRGQHGQDDHRQAVVGGHRQKAEQDQAAATSVAITTASTDRRPSLLPVDVLEVQPERVLVERQPRADAERRGHDLEAGTAGLQREHEAREQHQHDAEHEVVNVQPAVGL